MQVFKLAVAVVLYNPAMDVYKNISSYLENINLLYIIDNSDHKNSTLVEMLKKNRKIQYMDNFQNLGIANALNMASEKAIEDGYTHLLTMDQDSRFRANDLNCFLEELKNTNHQIGILSPLSHENEDKLFPFYELVSITSGSIFNLDAYKKTGPFKSKLFIDYVDIEYCLRMKQNGYILKKVNSIVLEHQLGDIKKFKLLFWQIAVTNHSALRRYYMTRNRFYVWNIYKKDNPEYIKYDKIAMIKELIKILLVEDNKMMKFKMSIRGYLDYRKNIFGKYEQ